MKSICKDFKKKFGDGKVFFDKPLSEYTVVGIGGPGEIVYEVEDHEHLIKAVKFAIVHSLPVNIIGGGSNVLVADRGLKGLVIVNRKGSYSLGDKTKKSKIKGKPQPRWNLDGQTVRYHFKDLDYDESEYERIKVTVDSGVILQKFMYDLIKQGITGLQWYSGIPGTLGGAVFNNLHGGTHFFSEVISTVKAIDSEGQEVLYDAEDLKSDYNYTIFHDNNDVIIEAELDLYLGDVAKSKYVADEWRERKHKIQPQKTLGCVFANISEEEKQKHDLPTTSVGYIIEHILEFTGYRKGNAFIPKLHHNFIETDGPAKAADYLQIIKDVKKAIFEELGIKVKPEIIAKGFTTKEIAGLYD
jgi:UDP-N-acetylmuramate dehydrogenase